MIKKPEILSLSLANTSQNPITFGLFDRDTSDDIIIDDVSTGQYDTSQGVASGSGTLYQSFVCNISGNIKTLTLYTGGTNGSIQVQVINEDTAQTLFDTSLTPPANSLFSLSTDFDVNVGDNLTIKVVSTSLNLKLGNLSAELSTSPVVFGGPQAGKALYFELEGTETHQVSIDSSSIDYDALQQDIKQRPIAITKIKIIADDSIQSSQPFKFRTSYSSGKTGGKPVNITSFINPKQIGRVTEVDLLVPVFMTKDSFLEYTLTGNGSATLSFEYYFVDEMPGELLANAKNNTNMEYTLREYNQSVISSIDTATGLRPINKILLLLIIGASLWILLKKIR